jgi:hypothetical protein
VQVKRDENVGLKKQEGNILVAASRRVFLETVIVLQPVKELAVFL